MKNIIIAFSLLFMIPGLRAQGFFSPNQTMVKGAVEQSLVIICSGYKLQDSTGQNYGRNNRAEFNHDYYLGIVTDSGLVTTHTVMQPWLYDADYTRYSNSYKPVLNTVSCRKISDDLYRQLQKLFDTISSSFLRLSVDSVKDVPALAVHTDTSIKNGWLLWVYVSDTLGRAGLSSVTAVTCPIETSDTVLAQRVNVPLSSSLIRDSIALRKAIGAVWVVPCYPKAGIVQFRVAGMTVRDGSEWSLVPLRIIKRSVNDTLSHDDETGNELTPSPEQQKGKKNKKNKKSK